MNVYLAGKIRENDWRETIVNGLSDAWPTRNSAGIDISNNIFAQFLNWPVMHKAIFSDSICPNGHEWHNDCLNGNIIIEGSGHKNET